MKYNFDNWIDRKDTMSQKWDAQETNFPDNPGALPMWVADMDFPCPRPIVDAVVKRAAHPIYGYSKIGSDSAGLSARWQKKRRGWDVDPDWITFSNGIVPALNAIVTAFTKPGEGVIIQPPVYYPFREAVENNGRTLVNNNLVYKDGKWGINFEKLEKLAAEENNKLLLFCHPLNPVSRVLTKEELFKVADICVRNQVLIAADEIHNDLVFPHCRFYSLASLSGEIASQTITATAPSKTFNIAGLQMSALIIPNKELKKKFEEEMQRRCYIPNLFGSVAFEAAYSHPECEEYLEQLLEYLWGNYLYTDEYLKKYMPGITCQKPDATYLLWLDFRKLKMKGKELETFCLKEAGLALDSGEWFGGEGEGYMRINIGCPRSLLRQALEQLKEAYDKRGF